MFIDQKLYSVKDLSGKSELNIHSPKFCKMVWVEETRKTDDNKLETKYFAYSSADKILYDSSDPNYNKIIIEHPCVVQKRGLVANK